MLAILTSHPIQYQSPLWRSLAASGLPLQVWYLSNHGLQPSLDREFGQAVRWDIDLLSGFNSKFLQVAQPASLRGFRGLRLRESLAERLRQEGVKALWIEGWRFQANWQALHAARKAGVQVWLRGDSNDLRRDGWLKQHVKRTILQRYMNRIDHFLCVGTANRRLYESYGVTPEKLHSAPHYVDNNRFRSAADELAGERAKFRREWKIPDGAFCVLFCGKFIPKKHPLDLVAAVRNLNSSTDAPAPVHMLFVGSGELGDNLRASCTVVYDSGQGANAASATSGKPTASLAGFLNQTEIARAYVAADLLVLPSDTGETWGLVVNEAMACGLPAAVSDQCGCAEDLVAPLDKQLIFRCGDVESLTAAIAHARATKFSSERVRSVADTHHMQKTIDTVVRLYEATHTKEGAAGLLRPASWRGWRAR